MLVQLAVGQTGRGEPECQTGAATRVHHGQLVTARRTTSPPPPHPDQPPPGGSSARGGGGQAAAAAPRARWGHETRRNWQRGGRRGGCRGGGRCRRIRHDPDLPDPQGQQRRPPSTGGGHAGGGADGMVRSQGPLQRQARRRVARCPCGPSTQQRGRYDARYDPVAWRAQCPGAEPTRTEP